MHLLSFLFSRSFFKQLLIAAVALLVFVFLTLKWLKHSTNHGTFITVPDITGKSLEVGAIVIQDNDLRMEVQDSANYNPNYPKFAVIEQYPEAGTSVKSKRKIYLTINPSGYRKVSMPNVVRQTYRQAKPTVEALGLVVENISYEDDLGKDEVIKVYHNDKLINAGDLIPPTSKVDFVLGNGKRKK